jgi:integrase
LHIPSLSQHSKPRKRALSVPELRAVWRLVNEQCAVNDTVHHRALKLAVLLGGQRCVQLLRARVDDVDLEGATILLLDPKGRRIHAREHRLPLLESALAEVQWLLQHARDAGSALLFPSAKPTVSVSPASVSKLVRDLRKKMMTDGTATAQFQFSDLRRKTETRLAALGVSKDLRAQLQSHGLGGVQARHYDQYEYMNEKRAALRTWEAFLNGLLKTT